MASMILSSTDQAGHIVGTDVGFFTVLLIIIATVFIVILILIVTFITFGIGVHAIVNVSCCIQLLPPSTVALS